MAQKNFIALFVSPCVRMEKGWSNTAKAPRTPHSLRLVFLFIIFFVGGCCCCFVVVVFLCNLHSKKLRTEETQQKALCVSERMGKSFFCCWISIGLWVAVEVTKWRWVGTAFLGGIFHNFRPNFDSKCRKNYFEIKNEQSSGSWDGNSIPYPPKFSFSSFWTIFDLTAPRCPKNFWNLLKTHRFWTTFGRKNSFWYSIFLQRAKMRNLKQFFRAGVIKTDPVAVPWGQKFITRALKNSWKLKFPVILKNFGGKMDLEQFFGAGASKISLKQFPGVKLISPKSQEITANWNFFKTLESFNHLKQFMEKKIFHAQFSLKKMQKGICNNFF